MLLFYCITLPPIYLLAFSSLLGPLRNNILLHSGISICQHIDKIHKSQNEHFGNKFKFEKSACTVRIVPQLLASLSKWNSTRSPLITPLHERSLRWRNSEGNPASKSWQRDRDSDPELPAHVSVASEKNSGIWGTNVETISHAFLNPEVTF